MSNTNHSSSATHHTLQKSTTLNRRYVRRPGALTSSSAKAPLKIKVSQSINITEAPSEAEIAKSPAITHIAISSSEPTPEPATEPVLTPEPTPEPEPKIEPAPIPTPAPTPTPQKTFESATRNIIEDSTSKAEKPLAKSFAKTKSKRKKSRFVLAFACSLACVAALGYLVHLNIPDISVKVAAIQTGIEASYPSYVPRDFQLSSVSTDQDNRIIMEFAGQDAARFTLSEEKSSWDSTALLNNYVKSAWRDAHTVIREQGITIYISNGGSAAWVNGGILYRIDVQSGTLTKKQIKNIVTSL